MSDFIITIDGPAGSGKSTISKLLAKRLGVSFLDTGAMYRAVTLAAIRHNVNLEDLQSLLAIFDKVDFDFSISNGSTVVKLNGQDCSEQIRLPEVTSKIKFIAGNRMLREKLIELQRAFAHQHGSIVTEGRDQGTVVFPDAQVKIFLVADVMERARRRALELNEKGQQCSIDDICRSISERDHSDQNREFGALRPAEDAIEVDTTGLSIQEVVDKVYGLVREKF